MLWAHRRRLRRRRAVGRFLLNAALLLVTYTAASTRSGFRTIVYGYLLASVVTSTYGLASGNYLAAGRLTGALRPELLRGRADSGDPDRLLPVRD